MGDLVEQLREEIIADAFESKSIRSGQLADRLIRERLNAADEIQSLRTQLAEAEARAKYWEAGYCSYVQCSLMNRVVRGEMPTAEAQALAEQTITAARSLITNTLESSDDEDGNVWKRIVPTPTTKED